MQGVYRTILMFELIFWHEKLTFSFATEYVDPLIDSHYSLLVDFNHYCMEGRLVGGDKSLIARGWNMSLFRFK